MGYGNDGSYGVGSYGNHCCGSGYRRGGNTFALIVVLFILLIIVGATFYN